MKHYSILFIFLFLLLSNCTKKERNNIPLDIEINDFVWKGMNSYYLWQNEVPALSDNRFSSQENLYSFLENFDNPKDLFNDLRYEVGVVDKWSWIVDDYIALENYFSGQRTSTGAKIKLYLTNENSEYVYGIVRYIIPDTDAASKPIHRGNVFNSVNGITLTKSNYYELLYTSESYTLNLGNYSYDSVNESVTITPNGNDVTLVKNTYTENPIYTKTTFDIDGNKVGYLMYNSFISNYNENLNDTFAYFQGENISELILDLRYNGGGSVQTASYLASMITGQFEGQELTHEVWNDKWQTWLEAHHPDWLINNFTNTMYNGTEINNLNLSRVIIITTENTASASELVINALKPYINVITVGSTTHGKYVASVTLYDSPNFSRENVNPDHNWAMQPIVLKEVNKLDEYAPEGFNPDIEIFEDFSNMGELGTASDPLLNRALSFIATGNRFIYNTKRQKTSQIITTFEKFENEMYIEKELPFQK